MTLNEYVLGSLMGGKKSAGEPPAATMIDQSALSDSFGLQS